MAIMRLGHEMSCIGTEADRWVDEAATWLVRGFDKEFEDGPDNPQDKREHLTQAFETVEKEWGHLDPFQALGQALDPDRDPDNLKSAKRASECDVRDERRKRFGREELTIVLDESAAEPNRGGVLPVDRAFLETWRRNIRQQEHDEDVRHVLRDVCNDHPALKLEAYADARMDNKNQKNAAKATGISTRTARKYEELLKAAFGPTFFQN